MFSVQQRRKYCTWIEGWNAYALLIARVSLEFEIWNLKFEILNMNYEITFAEHPILHQEIISPAQATREQSSTRPDKHMAQRSFDCLWFCEKNFQPFFWKHLVIKAVSPPPPCMKSGQKDKVKKTYVFDYWVLLQTWTQPWYFHRQGLWCVVDRMIWFTLHNIGANDMQLKG